LVAEGRTGDSLVLTFSSVDPRRAAALLPHRWTCCQKQHVSGSRRPGPVL